MPVSSSINYPNNISAPFRRVKILYDRLLVLSTRVTDNQNISFPTPLSKIYYLIEQSGMDESQSDITTKICYYAGGQKLPDSHTLEYIADSGESIISLIESSITADNTFRSLIGTESDDDKAKTLDIQLIVNSDPVFEEGKKKTVLQCLTQAGKHVSLKVTGIWAKQVRSFSKGDKFNAISLIEDEDGNLSDYRKTIIVFEPDYLYDVSEIAKGFDIKDISATHTVLSRYSVGTPSSQMLLGSMINTIFDEMLVDDSLSFDTLYQKAIKGNAMLLFTVSKLENIAKQYLYDQLKIQYDNLLETIKELRQYNFSAEPSFISTRFGLQGRLDLLIEKGSDYRIKDIYELKGGKPIGSIMKYTDNKKRDRIYSVWPSHGAQLIGYDMLLDSSFSGRLGSNFIIYSRDPHFPIRNTLRSIRSKQKLAFIRNMIVLEETELARGINSSYKRLESYIKKAPRFSISEIENVLRQVSSLPDYKLEYYNDTSIQIAREIVAGKTGRYSQNRRGSYNSIWCDKDSISNIAGLRLTGIESEKGYLDFKRSDLIDSPIRKGDAIILFRTNNPENNCDNWFDGQVLKAAIKSINSENIEVTLRNKLINYSVFKGHEDDWSLALDYFDSTLRKLHSEAFRFVQSPDFDLLSGRDFSAAYSSDSDEERKESDNLNNLDDFENVTSEQNHLLKKAIAANKLYFLEGPPGTGKTRYFISNLLKYYFFRTDKKILLVSYTNRAVDEATIAAMKALGEDNHSKIIRYGSRDSSEAREVLFPEILDQLGTHDTYRAVRGCRVYCSTISSLISNRDIFQIIDFDVAIVDESGQIAEYYLNILLGRIEKTILIGDSKQLPPITISNQIDDSNNDESGIDVRKSYFTRMISLIKQEDAKTQENLFGMLTHQGRMDLEIMKAANLLSYQNTLKSIHGKDRAVPNNLKGINFRDISSEPSSTNTNKSEAEAVVSIAVLIKSNLDSIKNDSIGIIAPFRKQCALIREMLPLELLPYITVDTVERYQGSERDHIILSTVISDVNQLEQITSNDSIDNELSSAGERVNRKPIDRKLNVALTRARHSFTLVGNLEILSFENNYKLLIENFKDKG